LISEEIARKLKVKLRSKIVITFQDRNGDITAGSFRVSGIFNSRSPQINQSVVYVRFQDLSRISLENDVNEIAILLNNFDSYNEFKSNLDPITSSEIRSFREIAPVFDLLEQSSKMTQQIITIIIMLALLFGIVNTMLMAVLERTKEIGMLRSVGMHRRLIFIMIMVETVLLGLVSAPFGLLLGYLTVYYLNNNGVDFSRYADALNDLGYDTIFYPFMENHMYFVLMAVFLLTPLIGAIYPALKAININPLEAIRKL
jgi:ABC-type lipoprotein release transport system permease subunit